MNSFNCAHQAVCIRTNTLIIHPSPHSNPAAAYSANAPRTAFSSAATSTSVHCESAQWPSEVGSNVENLSNKSIRVEKFVSQRVPPTPHTFRSVGNPSKNPAASKPAAKAAQRRSFS